MRELTRLEDMNETGFDAFVFGGRKGAATVLGWRSFHDTKARGSVPGYPDRTAWRERIIFVELKVDKNKPSDAQHAVLDGLARAGGEVYVWLPPDFEAEIKLVLGLRCSFGRTLVPWLGQVVPHLAAQAAPRSTEIPDRWVPRSMWLPGVGRADQHHEYEAFCGRRPSR